MKDIIPAKKQSPILGLTGMGGGVGSNLGGSLTEKTYIEDVYSTHLYIGNMTDRNINTGVDMSGKGGLAWLYVRAGSGVDWGTGGTDRTCSRSSSARVAARQAPRPRRPARPRCPERPTSPRSASSSSCLLRSARQSR